MRISVNVDESVMDDVEDAIIDGIEDSLDFGAAEAGQPGVPEQAKNVAKGRIVEAGAVFSGDLLESFEVNHSQSKGVWHVELENTSAHAEPIEYGAEYGEKGPPVAALIPWVETKMRGFQVPEDDVADLPEPDVVRQESEGVKYGPDVLTLADEDTLTKAFWLQQHIKEEGLDALRYMKAAEYWAESSADKSVAAFITKHLNSI